MSDNSFIPSAAIKQVAFLFLLLVLGFILFYYLKSYLNGVLGALVLYILFRPAHLYLTEKSGWRNGLSIMLLFVLSFAIMLLPVWFVASLISGKIAMVIHSYEEILELIRSKIDLITGLTGFDVLSTESIAKITNWAAGIVPELVSSTFGTIGQFAIMYFVLFFMLSAGRNFESWAKSFSPFSDSATAKLLSELKKMTLSNAVGIPLLGFVQAVFAGLAYWFLGVEEPLLWAVVTGIFSVVPVVGTTIVWVPLSVLLYFNGSAVKAAVLLGYGLVIIANIDNVFRFVVQKKFANIHPLITFFGVLIGLEIFGFMGIIFGPLLIAYFLTLIGVYREEYSSATLQ